MKASKMQKMIYFVFKGLGTEVVKRSEELAAELGCTHTYAHVTGIL